MCMGVKAFPYRSATPSQSSLWRALTRPPFLQSRAWEINNAEFQPSQNLGSYGGSRTYFRKRAYHHSCAPSSVPFTVDSCTVSHSPIFFTCQKQLATWTRAPARVSAIASSYRLAFRFRTYSLLSLINLVWSASLNSSWPMIAATRFPLMTQDAVHFSGAFSVGSGRVKPPCFSGR